MTAVLSLSSVSVGYRTSRSRSHCVVTGISEEISAGELVCLIGPNGGGKSTLLRTAAGMQPPLGGSVSLLGSDLHRMPKRDLARRVSVVLTSKVSVGQLTGWELAALGRMPYTNWSGNLSTQDYGIVTTALRDAGALQFGDKQVAELSDGERQKVMLARALAQEPRLMILDEITAFLDLPRRIEIMTVLRELAHRDGKAILLSTHDLELALSMADRLWILPTGKSLVTGVPEDLVLDGVFARAFASEGLHFDTLKGGFTTVGLPRREIPFAGSGIGAAWTRRALARKGLALVEANPGSRPILSVSESEGRYRWHLLTGDGLEEHRSVASLLGSPHFPGD
jgi:iron complex transport system ATP-binding protein